MTAVQTELSFDGIADQTFPVYHLANPQIYEDFKKYTLKAISRGFKNNSADAIFHIIRWETATAATNFDGYKINNNYSSFYSRLFMNEYPEYSGFFRIRKSKFDPC